MIIEQEKMLAGVWFMLVLIILLSALLAAFNGGLVLVPTMLPLACIVFF